ncbi:MAG: dihydrolipoyl dehydrogenase [SAR324 cluster bacterium]|uniref:Dihydrolipoyl dehydrogenase n=1 Tax=SAR324 cluster bacterium TaxID=2024889 RepID=A0A2A4T5S1_9DELT|nr:MAG: dihydrolipoyl dehydrogenase [SAR324 cluster bacterium]
MDYDVVVIGSGPGGYVGAIRFAQLGFKTALVERYSTLGGTCLNVGCIPSKALLDSSEHFYQAKTHFATHGIRISDLEVDWETMVGRKEKVVADTCKGIEFLMKKNKIDVHQGHASFLDANTIAINGDEKKITTKHTLIATGSKPAELPNITLDKDRIISSTEALSLKEIPKKMVIIGAGAIGLEMGSVYARLGCQVEVLEFHKSVIPLMDAGLGKELLRTLKKMGMKLHLSHQVQAVESKDGQVTVTAKNASGKMVEITADYCLVATGRKPFTESLGLEKVGIETNERGFIPVNENLETSVPGIYAIGDVIGGAMLAHKAEEEAVFVAELLAGQKPHVNHNLIPNVVYTWPEVASVGKTEEELKAEQRAYKSGSFNFRALGRARAANEVDGFIKVLADEKTDEILGVHMIGARAADMIGEAVLAMEYRASAEDVARTCHAHPTFTEALKEACLAATENRALHA